MVGSDRVADRVVKTAARLCALILSYPHLPHHNREAKTRPASNDLGQIMPTKAISKNERRIYNISSMFWSELLG